MVRRGLTLFWCLLVLQIIWRIFFTPIWRIVQLDRLRTRLTPALIARDDPVAISGAEKPFRYSMIFASCRAEASTFIPSALAVLRLMTSRHELRSSRAAAFASARGRR
jgi:hypothetical protein